MLSVYDLRMSKSFNHPNMRVHLAAALCLCAMVLCAKPAEGSSVLAGDECAQHFSVVSTGLQVPGWRVPTRNGKNSTGASMNFPALQAEGSMRVPPGASACVTLTAKEGGLRQFSALVLYVGEGQSTSSEIARCASSRTQCASSAPGARI